MSQTPVQTGGYQLPEFAFVTPPELAAGTDGADSESDADGAKGAGAASGRVAAPASGSNPRYALVIIGAGLSGLALACDLAQRGVTAVVLDDDNTVGVRGASSRGIVYAQKTLEIMDRLGIYERIRAKGAVWSVGKTLAGHDVVYEFDAATASDSKQPPFINLQQFYLEWFMVDRIVELGRTDLRWQTKVIGYTQHDDHAVIEVNTPQGPYTLEADWVCDCSGVNSLVRDALNIRLQQARGIDRWCISDVRFKKKLPVERWTWVEAPFNGNRAVWQHLMADDVWRMDFQMGPDTDLEYVSRHDVAAERIRRQLGNDVEFELVWVGPYSYRAQLIEQFRKGRTFFLGDSAHAMSPFGARGGNSGIQDADNLGWKLALVLQGRGPASLLDSYHAERRPAAQFNIMTTRRTARFLQPESPAEKILRDAAISLAKEYPFARSLCNTGRLSTSYIYSQPPSSKAQKHKMHGVASAAPDGAAAGVGSHIAGAVTIGEAVQNVEITSPDGRRMALADLFRGHAAMIGFWSGSPATLSPDIIRLANQLVAGGAGAPLLRMLEIDTLATGLSSVRDHAGQLARALGVGKKLNRRESAFFLLRPDMHLAARIAQPTAAKVKAALRRALEGKA